MNLKKIIKEEVNDFDWAEGVEPKLKTFTVRYMMEMTIQAYDYEEAVGIYENVDLSDVNSQLNHDMETPGIRSTEWYNTVGDVEEIDEY